MFDIFLNHCSIDSNYLSYYDRYYGSLSDIFLNHYYQTIFFNSNKYGGYYV